MLLGYAITTALAFGLIIVILLFERNNLRKKMSNLEIEADKKHLQYLNAKQKFDYTEEKELKLEFKIQFYRDKTVELLKTLNDYTSELNKFCRVANSESNNSTPSLNEKLDNLDMNNLNEIKEVCSALGYIKGKGDMIDFIIDLNEKYNKYHSKILNEIGEEIHGEFKKIIKDKKDS
jgi:hypothetical protein